MSVVEEVRAPFLDAVELSIPGVRRGLLHAVRDSLDAQRTT